MSSEPSQASQVDENIWLKQKIIKLGYFY